MPLSTKELKVHTDRLIDEALQWFDRAGVYRRPPCETADLGYLFTGGLVTNRAFEAYPQSIMTYDLSWGCIELERSLRLGYDMQATFCGLRGTVQDGGVWFTQMLALSRTEPPTPEAGGYEVWRPFLREAENAKKED